MKIETEKLKDAALDYAVGIIEKAGVCAFDGTQLINTSGQVYAPSSSADCADAIFAEVNLRTYDSPVQGKKAVITPDEKEPFHWFQAYGETAVMAGLRCLVRYKLGDVIEIPEEIAQALGYVPDPELDYL